MRTRLGKKKRGLRSATLSFLSSDCGLHADSVNNNCVIAESLFEIGNHCMLNVKSPYKRGRTGTGKCQFQS